MSDPLKEAMAVLDAYMAGLNRGDEAAVNAACNFPHVRLAGGKVVVWPDHGDYKLADFVARAGDGWARSQWDERAAIHVGTIQRLDRLRETVVVHFHEAEAARTTRLTIVDEGHR